MRISNTLRKSVLVTNTETGDVKEFSSLTEAGKYLGISRVSVNKYLLDNLPYKEYIISKPSLTDKDTFSPLKETSLSQQPVLLTNTETGKVIEFSSMTEAARHLDISRARLWYFFSETVKTGNETIKGYTISKIADAQNKV